GDKAYSSWSMRGWLLLDAFRLDYREEEVPMYTDAFTAMAETRAPARSVPQIAWQENGVGHRVWDTLAITETLAERHPDAGHWPADPSARAHARVLAAQMHAGFGGFRAAAPMNLHRHAVPLQAPPSEMQEGIDRLEELWTWAVATTGGPWLAGKRFSAADVFAVPYAFRLTGYALGSESTAGYVARLQEHPSVRRWVSAAKADPRRLAIYDDLR
ncbi:MAG: glutathione S-transferase C-terminal domain-containing protein, partial [Pseudomonadota bacterium]